MNDYEDEVMPYKKKSSRKPPKKAKHKHDWEPVIFEWLNPNYKYDKNKGFVEGYSYYCGKRCKICGRLESDKWPAIRNANGTYTLIADAREYAPDRPIVRIKDYYSKNIEEA